ncbi:MAG: UDP-N-acetylmuramoyl-L-alanyl-D-glutamate--2,6-diaminopimelate ligase [Candidatus Cohnella colombiensis]|uniref:UDP-N-acetylmuramoyl-L-alanyl-D-glutamate--2,6-diaminopimelate ligase n=1 Tax=Candidatus Cohnella colombiensis TaxID=3121368 RepID=A0AA95JBL4_9BACL|nr:MAG: UDP-N-acetylmuramoyl-L-alanyl-D-glutamate--2,6-diaminopimelate ligase [Cohnella sp.]
MRLRELADQLLVTHIVGNANVEVTALASDSRLSWIGSLFFCLPGLKDDGHSYALQAIEHGAVALVTARELPLNIPQLIVQDTRQALAMIADYYYGRPSQLLRPIAVTGTNGKTTTTYLIERILLDRGITSGVIGTIETRFGGSRFPMSGTTPDVIELQRIFKAMVEAGTNRCIMEVSSHALAQGRVKGCYFRTAIFTNLTQDHLDYHGSMKAYEEAKGLLFSRLGNTYIDDEARRTYAILNVDDPTSAHMMRMTASEVLTYGIDREAHLRASNVTISASGTSFTLHSFWGSRQVNLKLVGKFNVYNALAALGAAICENINIVDAVSSLERITGVPGRVEAIDEGQDYAVIVDYAHTPDGLDNVLRTVRELTKGRVICVFGCGGDRDRAKRPMMGRIAAEHADILFITSDNPRSEDPDIILRHIEAGLLTAAIRSDRYTLEPDRKVAIEKAVEIASPGDVVLIAGKGHETYQHINGVAYDFDDRLIAKEAIRSRTN